MGRGVKVESGRQPLLSLLVENMATMDLDDRRPCFSRRPPREVYGGATPGNPDSRDVLRGGFTGNRKPP